MRQEKRSRKKIWRLVIFWNLALLMAIWMQTGEVQAASMENAPMVALDGKWSQDYWMTDNNTTQWYKIMIPSAGKLTCKVMAYEHVEFEYLTEGDLKRLQGNVIWGSLSSPSTKVDILNLSAGTYYLKMYPRSGAKYKLNFYFESFGANDGAAISYDSPQTIFLNQTVTGALTKTDEEDWYRIHIMKAGIYQYQIAAYTRVAHELWTEDLSKKLKSGSLYGDETSPRITSYEVMLSPGIYYLKTYPAVNYNTGKYTLKFAPLNKDNCSHSYEITNISATFAAKGYQLHKCKKCGYSYKDHYTEKRQLSVPYMYVIQSGKKKATVNWSGVSYASGYQISCKCGNTTKTYQVKKASASRKTIKKLKPKKKCVFRVRAYRKEGGVTVYSKWSKKKSIRIR